MAETEEKDIPQQQKQEEKPSPKKVTLATAFPSDELIVPEVGKVTREGVELTESDAKKVQDAAKNSGAKVQEVKK